MSRPPVAHAVLRAADVADRVPADVVKLDYEARFLRRRTLTSAHDLSFLVDLPETMSLDHGDCFVLDDDTLVEIIAAEEDLFAVHGPDMVRLAWHIGNRHTPCQIEPDRLLIRRDKVIADMLARLGAHVHPVSEPFVPEGGAYGMGRTHGHDHSHVHVHVGHGHEPADDDEPDDDL